MPQTRSLIAAQVGDRVRVQTQLGIKDGTIKKIDDSIFPYVVTVKGDDGEDYRVLVGIGWPT